ncbi:MAG: N-acetyltransferase family protein [Oscillospiraceae bacterium]
MPNDASSALHQKLGFRVLGTYRNTGYKNGRWLDVVWFEKPIGSFTGEPRPLIPTPSSPKPPPSSPQPTHKPTPAPRRKKQRGARRFRQRKRPQSAGGNAGLPACNPHVVYF